jgi:choline-sulfatase
VPPNVLVLMSDQHVPFASGAYGSEIVRTPHLDRLAERGTVFDAAYCNSPICVPSRAAMATGRYVHRTGNYDNASPYRGIEAPSWGHRVERAGIPLVTFGKLHYRSADDDTGFGDQRLPLHVRNATGDLYHCLRERQPPAPQLRGAVVGTERGESDYTRQDRAVAEAAADWLTREAPRTGPWVAKVSLVTPHYPFTVPAEFVDLYPEAELPLPVRNSPDEWDRHPAVDFYRRSCGLDEPLPPEETRRSLAHYFGLVSFMDAQLGMVLDALERSGQAERTVVLYVSDHGELMGTDGTWFKGTMAEHGTRNRCQRSRRCARDPSVQRLLRRPRCACRPRVISDTAHGAADVLRSAHGLYCAAGVSAVPMRMARARMCEAMVKPRSAGVLSA